MKKMLFLVIVLLMGACSRQSINESKCNETIKIGVNIEFNNPDHFRSGILEWSEGRVNVESILNGCQIEIIEYQADLNNGTEFVVENMRKLIEVDKVSVIVGPTDIARINAIAPLALEYKVPVIIPDLNGNLNNDDLNLNEFLYIYKTKSSQNIKSLSKYLYEDKSYRKVTLYKAINEISNLPNYLEVFSSEFELLSGNKADVITAYESYKVNLEDFSQSDAIVIYGFSEIAGGLVAQIKSLNSSIPIIGMYSTFTNYNFSSSVLAANLGVNDDNLDGMSYLDTFTTLIDNESTRLYLDSPNMTPSSLKDTNIIEVSSEALGFDVILLILNVIDDFGTNPNDFVKGLNDIDYVGLFGKVVKNENALESTGFIFTMENGITTEANSISD